MAENFNTGRESRQFDHLFTLQFSGLADLLRRPSGDQCSSCSKSSIIFQRTHYSHSSFVLFLACGASHREERIVGGKVAEVNSYPWLAALQYRHKFYCGGALISNR